MAQRPRTLLINPSGRKLLNQLTEEYPAYTWVLALIQDKEVCVGYKEGKPAIVGSDYITIKTNLTL